MSLTLEARNFFGLRSIRWTLPGGVCALVGPNGSGKTTLLRLPMFLRAAMEHGIGNAAGLVGGPASIRHFDAQPDEVVTVGVSVDDVEWSLRLLPTPATIDCEDRLMVKGVERFRREPFANSATFDGEALVKGGGRHVVMTPNGGPALRALLQERPAGFDAAAPLVRTLTRWQMFEEQNYEIRQLRTFSSGNLSDAQLSPNGTNVFTVMRNWRDSRATRPRWEFVLSGLRAMFPDLFDDIEFMTAGQQLAARFVRPGRQEAIPHHLAPNGWLVGLLQLCAVASTDAGGVVALDEPENALHPFAIRRLMESLDEWSERQQLTVILATHSPVIINQFDKAPERLFVMQPGEPVLPVALDRLRDPAWLKGFALGDLFIHDEFGAPVVP